MFGDQPRAVGGPHLDFHQDDQARQEFHQEFPVLDNPRSEMKLMLEETNDEESSLECGNHWPQRKCVITPSQ